MYCTFSKWLAGHWHDMAFKWNRQNDKIWAVRGTEYQEERGKEGKCCFQLITEALSVVNPLLKNCSGEHYCKTLRYEVSSISKFIHLFSLVHTCHIIHLLYKPLQCYEQKKTVISMSVQFEESTSYQWSVEICGCLWGGDKKLRNQLLNWDCYKGLADFNT